MSHAAEEQRFYYEQTASKYDSMHLQETEHEYALSQLLGLMRYYGFKSLLDVGAGTGRVLRHASSHLENVTIAGVEPVLALREIGYHHGLNKDQLRDGNALDLQFQDDSWDIVCAFGILHHISEPEKAIVEMSRVAKHGVFFSDLNNYGCGSLPQRTFSQALRSIHAWRPFQFIKNGGKYEKYSEGDGIHYSYSLFDSLPTIRRKFDQIHLSNTKGNHSNLYRGCSHISVFAVKNGKVLEHRNSTNTDR